MSKELLIKKARDDWNSSADEHNQWGDLGFDEKLAIVAAAAIAQPADEPSLSMSMFASKADYDAAMLAQTVQPTTPIAQAGQEPASDTEVGYAIRDARLLDTKESRKDIGRLLHNFLNLRKINLPAAPQPAAVEPVQPAEPVATHTTGHCEEKAGPNGCQLHNLQCGYPKCNSRAIAQPVQPSIKVTQVENHDLNDSTWSDKKHGAMAKEYIKYLGGIAAIARRAQKAILLARKHLHELGGGAPVVDDQELVDSFHALTVLTLEPTAPPAIKVARVELTPQQSESLRCKNTVSIPGAFEQPTNRPYASPVKTVADLVNNLLTLDQSLPIYGAQYIDHPTRGRCAIAFPPILSHERVEDSRWIGTGKELNSVVVWTRAEQPEQYTPQVDKLASLEQINPAADLQVAHGQLSYLMKDQAAKFDEITELRKDSERLDYIQEHGSTVEIMPGMDAAPWTFRVGGLHASRNGQIREAIDEAIAQEVQPKP